MKEGCCVMSNVYTSPLVKFAKCCVMLDGLRRLVKSFKCLMTSRSGRDS